MISVQGARLLGFFSEYAHVICFILQEKGLLGEEVNYTNYARTLTRRLRVLLFLLAANMLVISIQQQYHMTI